MKPLAGKVAVVAGATRGLGRAIAVTLGEAGATVYCTGRSSRGNLSSMGRKETIEETAELVTAKGGRGISVRVDHTQEEQVKALFAQVALEQEGQLDLLINDLWGGDPLTDWQRPFWEHSLADGLQIQRQAVAGHLITSYHGAPLMVARGKGLIIEVTDGADYRYRGNLYYSLAKISAIHLAEAMAADLKSHGVTAVAVTPGFLRSEAMLEHFGVTEANWQEAIQADPHFSESETPYFLARGIVALVSDPAVHQITGQALTSWGLSDTYGIVDLDGRRPHWGAYAAKHGF